MEGPDVDGHSTRRLLGGVGPAVLDLRSAGVLDDVIASDVLVDDVTGHHNLVRHVEDAIGMIDGPVRAVVDEASGTSVLVEAVSVQVILVVPDVVVALLVGSGNRGKRGVAILGSETDDRRESGGRGGGG